MLRRLHRHARRHGEREDAERHQTAGGQEKEVSELVYQAENSNFLSAEVYCAIGAIVLLLFINTGAAYVIIMLVVQSAVQISNSAQRLIQKSHFLLSFQTGNFPTKNVEKVGSPQLGKSFCHGKSRE